MAATRLIALHKNKGKSVAACLKSRTDYAKNPDKTNRGELVSSYECSPLTADEEFMLSKRQYELATGRRQKNDVIAYQIRQSFRPGEITAEEANAAKVPGTGAEISDAGGHSGKTSRGKRRGLCPLGKAAQLKRNVPDAGFLQENKIGSIEEMQERVDAATARYHELGDSIKASEKRLAEIAVLKAHIINYAKTRPVYDAYRKTGYSKRFLETHRTEITLHKAAKAAFDEADLKKLPKVKELDAEYSKLLTEKKARYPDYRKAKEEMQEFLRAQKNIELFFNEEKKPEQTEHSR